MEIPMYYQCGGLSPSDKARLLQCTFCRRDVSICGCNETDEDASGLCKKYQGDRNDILKNRFGIPMVKEKLYEAGDSYWYFMKNNFGIDESEEV